MDFHCSLELRGSSNALKRLLNSRLNWDLKKNMLHTMDKAFGISKHHFLIWKIRWHSPYYEHSGSNVDRANASHRGAYCVSTSSFVSSFLSPLFLPSILFPSGIPFPFPFPCPPSFLTSSPCLLFLLPFYLIPSFLHSLLSFFLHSFFPLFFPSFLFFHLSFLSKSFHSSQILHLSNKRAICFSADLKQRH